jgi:hypothetical protein
MKDHNCHIPIIVILFLGSAMLISMIGTIWLVSNGKDPAVVMVVSGLCNAALGFLGGMLSQTTGRATDQHGATPVTVTNAPGDPVPVTSEDG